jgi:methionyl-tRNA formyltransferase
LGKDIPVLQPVRIKTAESVEELKKYEADVFVVAAFGQILSKEILEMPPFGCLNIHASLLPKYRGASPIAWSILNGDDKTGVTIMQMDDGIDTGDMLLQKEIPIAANETTDSLFDKLMILGGQAIVEVLSLLGTDKITPVKQNSEEATHVGKFAKNFGEIQWQESAEVIERKVRGLNSWPSAYTFFQGKRMKIWEAEVIDESFANQEEIIEAGMVCKVEKDAIYVQTGENILKLISVQLEGKKRMNVKEFLLGYQVKAGEILGKESE